MKRYSPKDIEPRWQKTWEEQGLYHASDATDKPKRYVLEYFPYPSGAAMHVGHVRNYTIGDVMTRFWRMQGYNVLHPMGWDAFGLPAENYAIKTGISPRQAIEENTTRFKQQLMQMGFSYDWSREINSTDPAYYKWTQWFFLMLLKKGLAYQQESLQWWCPHDKTVLANEQVEAGRCWRCGNEVEKKALKQWFFKITDYADRLLDDLDDLDWSDAIKSMQRNWIGRSKGAEVDFKLANGDDNIRVFTTRPDTLFGATFMVLAPEHPLVKQITTSEQKAEVQDYIKQAQGRSDIERQETDHEKTGVFTGGYAINPVNNEKVPVWVADYVLMGYGTGAIMAVPAHDERDYEFAQKFELPIKPVVAPEYIDQRTPTRPDAEKVEREVAQLIVKHPSEEKYLLLNRATWETTSYSFVMGGLDEDETPRDAALRELLEETGYKHAGEVVEAGMPYYVEFYHEHKKINRRAFVHSLFTQLKDLDQDEVEEEEKRVNVPEWLTAEEVLDKIHGEGSKRIFTGLLQGQTAGSGEGIMINSGAYDGLSASEAREKIVADLAKQGTAEEKVNYKMRDWLISRQRYWGAPIPVIHCPKDGAVPVPEDQLPVVLPELTKFEPSGDGRSPLANVEEFVKTECPKCGGPAERETDTMDGFACSSWYFLRFADPHNDNQPFDHDKAKFWLPVDDYIGGAEHAVMHLLYARFWTKVMFDEGLVNFQEPFKALRNQGMILAPDGQKMSKSKGNTIEPDELISQGYGADSIRIMELFIGPWNQSANWSVEGIGGAFRFLQRIWTLVQEHVEAPKIPFEESMGMNGSKELQRIIHLATKEVTEDLRDMRFNTAIASLMESVNEMYKLKTIMPLGNEYWQTDLEVLIKLVAPFAPHLAEELWSSLGRDGSVHAASWPVWHEAVLETSTMTIVVQVNGKVRANITVDTGADEEQVVAAAKAEANVQTHLNGEPKKVIYVPGKLVSFVA